MARNIPMAHACFECNACAETSPTPRGIDFPGRSRSGGLPLRPDGRRYWVATENRSWPIASTVGVLPLTATRRSGAPLEKSIAFRSTDLRPGSS